jgi:hypothetical protein
VTRQKFATDVAIAPQFSKAAHWPDSFRRYPLRRHGGDVTVNIYNFPKLNPAAGKNSAK